MPFVWPSRGACSPGIKPTGSLGPLAANGLNAKMVHAVGRDKSKTHRHKGERNYELYSTNGNAGDSSRRNRVAFRAARRLGWRSEPRLGSVDGARSWNRPGSASSGERP